MRAYKCAVVDEFGVLLNVLMADSRIFIVIQSSTHYRTIHITWYVSIIIVYTVSILRVYHEYSKFIS